MQRCKNPDIAKKGILLSIVFWGIFDFLTLACALYAIGTISPDQALLTYPLLAFEVLPTGLLGLFLIGIIATIMSTIDSLSLISAITFGRDILWRIEKNNSETNSILLMKKGLIIISFFSLILSFLLPSVVALFYTLGSILIPGLILPFLYSLTQKNNMLRDHAVGWMLFLFWYPFLGLQSQTNRPNTFRIGTFYPGIATSFLYYLLLKSRFIGGY